MKKIACNLREAPEEKRLPNRRLQRSVFVVYVSLPDCAAWADVSSVLPLGLFLFTAYISGGWGGKNLCPFELCYPSLLFAIKRFVRRFLRVVKLLVFLGVSNFVAHGSH